MRVIPVLDVLGGVVVRAVGGRRDEYQPIRSRLTSSTELSEVATALRNATGCESMYVADLDAIRGGPRLTLPELGVSRVFLDSGLWVPEESAPPGIVPVVGLETAAAPGDFPSGEHHNAFSFDLFHGKLWKNWEPWATAADGVLELAEQVAGLGFRTWIVIDIGRVGGAEGPGTEEILRQLHREFPEIELLAGGGVRGWDDVRRLSDAGAAGVLVSTALHDGSLV